MCERRRTINLRMRDEVRAALRSPNRRSTGEKNFPLGEVLVSRQPRVLERERAHGRDILGTRDRISTHAQGPAVLAICGNIGALVSKDLEREGSEPGGIGRVDE